MDRSVIDELTRIGTAWDAFPEERRPTAREHARAT